MGLTVGLAIVQKRKLLALLGVKPQFLGCPACRLVAELMDSVITPKFWSGE
jgi:hypothetical protein